MPNAPDSNWIGRYAAILSALVAAAVGIGQYRRGVSQNVRELEWKQAEMARTLVNGMTADEGWQAMTMLDWEERRDYQIAPDRRVHILPRDVPVALEASLRANGPQRTETQRFITDRFDRFLFTVSQLQAAVRSGLVLRDDVMFPLNGTSRSGSANARSCCLNTSQRTQWLSRGSSWSLLMPGSDVLLTYTLMTLVLCSAALTASAQTPQNTPDAGAPPAPKWSARASVATYILPDDDNYVQPTVTADRGALHLEGRYNYEDRHSVSGFVGWNLEAGSKVKLEVTPMFGGVVGDTNGVIPAIEATLSFSRFEAYSEGEYVIDVDNHDDRFLYNWSEVSVWATDWLRAGLVTQRTRTFLVPQHSERDIQRGLLAGISIRNVEGTFYLFNPGSDDYYVVASISLSF